MFGQRTCRLLNWLCQIAIYSILLSEHYSEVKVRSIHLLLRVNCTLDPQNYLKISPRSLNQSVAWRGAFNLESRMNHLTQFRDQMNDLRVQKARFQDKFRDMVYQINQLNIANKYKNILNFNIECHMLYVKSIKGFKVRREIFLLLCHVQKKHMSNLLFCRVKKTHGKFIVLPCAKYLPCVFQMTHNKIVVCRVLEMLPTTSFGHAANTPFPVVMHVNKGYII